ncbi:hypothetical protein AZ006_001002 [Citrobacter freundii]|uniref:DUF4145 domain-containing protein n=1 Tax=Enterobacteriaceae TaxID=543 RepID=UPI000A3B8D1C|nr:MULTISPECIES: DUF4145 domain-containing protein [Enterobacteriaceae]EBF2118278.1 DUF4145 domain-containing protein [Salmonella enterica]ECY1126731.1 DUF4145 domain-containing protein [Salmonella enterica]EFB5211937.1 DUF4145 domain-containing protein [Escherichia coli]EGD5118861.1 DUF4145 domain-containing protein [Escherichia coli]EGS9150934.1 DUF4145 domain-containing protein [Salmonella enterica]
MAMFVDNCPRCGAQKIAFDVRGVNCFGSYKAFAKEEVPAYEAYCVCRECHKTTIFLCTDVNKRQPLDSIDWGMALFGLKDVACVIRPISPADLSVGEPPEFLPPHINAAYEEGAKCLAIGCFNAAATMFRLCLDYATKGLVPDGEQGPAQKIKRSLGLRMEWLFENHILPEALRELAECVKDDGNDGAHEGILDKAAAEDLEDFTYIFLERLYTEPQRLVEARARREERRNKGS